MSSSSNKRSEMADRNEMPDEKRVKQSGKEHQPAQDAPHRATPNSAEDEWMKKPPFQLGVDLPEFEKKYTSTCWCGKVSFAYGGEPLQSKMCHCGDCQRLHGAPFQHSAIFQKADVRLESTAEWLGFLSAHGEVHPLAPTPTPLPHKISCRACGSPLVDEGRNMIMAFPPSFDFPRNKDGKKELPKQFQPQSHIFYSKRTMEVRDGVDKWAGHKDESAKLDDDGNVIEQAPSKEELEKRKKEDDEKKQQQDKDSS